MPANPSGVHGLLPGRYMYGKRKVLILADAGKQKALLVEQGFLEFGR